MKEVGRIRMQKKYGEAGCRRSREYQNMEEIGRQVLKEVGRGRS